MHRSELREAVRLFPLRLPPWLRFVVRRGAYRYLTAAELCATRRSETVFVFGSGASLNEIGAEEWRAFEEGDTLGFNWFVHQRFVRCDYHLIRGIPDADTDPSVWRPQLDEYFGLIRSNPRFARTVFLVQGGFRAINGNRTIGGRYLPADSTIFRWKSNVRADLPARSFEEGLTHGYSTLQECVNLAYLAGWRRIVLVGVDLYDRRYFWLPADVARSVDVRRGADPTVAHARAATGMVAALAEWRALFAREGVELLVHNPKSLLAPALPVYASSPVPADDAGAR